LPSLQAEGRFQSTATQRNRQAEAVPQTHRDASSRARLYLLQQTPPPGPRGRAARLPTDRRHPHPAEGRSQQNPIAAKIQAVWKHSFAKMRPTARGPRWKQRAREKGNLHGAELCQPWGVRCTSDPETQLHGKPSQAAPAAVPRRAHPPQKAFHTPATSSRRCCSGQARREAERRLVSSHGLPGTARPRSPAELHSRPGRELRVPVPRGRPSAIQSVASCPPAPPSVPTTGEEGAGWEVGAAACLKPAERGQSNVPCPVQKAKAAPPGPC